MLFLERTFIRTAQNRWTRPSFARHGIDARHRFRGGLARPPRQGFSGHAFNAPTQTQTRFSHVFRACFRPVFSAPKIPEFWADKPFTRCLDRRTEWSVWNPLGSTGGDPNTLAPNRLKARTTPLCPSRTSTSS